MNTVLLEEMTWPEVKQAMEEGKRTVLIFAASIEQHGKQLAENTDTILGYAEAQELARRLGDALVAPVIRPGLSEHHMPLPGSITLRPDVFKGIVEDYVASYVRHGFQNIVLTSSHGGNFGALEEIAVEQQAQYPNNKIVTGYSLKEMSTLLFKTEKAFGLPLGTAGGHACDFETSAMLAIAPQHVRMDKAEPGFVGEVTDEFLAKFFKDGVTAVSPNGVLGDPTGSTAERGEKYLDIFLDLLEKCVREKLAQ